MMSTKRIIVLMAMVLIALNVEAQHKKKEPKGEFYFSWGYNKEWYTHSTVHVIQPGIGNDYKLEDVKAHDHIGWDEGLFKIALTIPQYNYRLGYIFDKEHGWGWEINFDHTKYIIADQNGTHIVGTLNNRHVDSTIAFNKANGFFWWLNNGANFLLFNVTKRWHFYQSPTSKVKIDLFAKGGIGPLIPHVQNELFGQYNDPHFQVGGWNIGTEGDIRATFFKNVYLEYGNKLDFASYSGLRLATGTARQSFGTYEMILSLGVTFPMGHRQL